MWGPQHKLGRKIGFRYLRAKKNNSVLSFITLICVGGVTVGVFALILTLSVMGGFEGELKKRLFSAETHVLVEGRQGQGIGVIQASSPTLTKLTELAKQPSSRIASVYPVLQTEAILRAGSKVSGVIMKGIQESQLEWLKTKLMPTDAATNAGDKTPVDSAVSAIYLGQELALDLGVGEGDKITLVSPVETEGPLGAVPRMRVFQVRGVFKTGVPEQEMHVAFSPQSEVEAFLRQSGFVTRIEVQVKKLEDAVAVSKQVQDLLGEGYWVRSWQELNAHLFQSLELERKAMFFTLLLIIVVAAFNIVSTLTMMVMEKKKSLSILRAIGATRKQISAIFLWEGIAIGIFGALLGGVSALVVCYVLDRYPIIQLPEFYYDRNLPVVVDPLSITLVIVSALIVVLIGAIFPARKAATITPLEGIRGD